MEVNDDVEIADYAREAVVALQCARITNGKAGELFAPQGNATRAEVTAIVHRFVSVTTGVFSRAQVDITDISTQMSVISE